MQDPKIQELIGQSPFASAIQSAMAAHITEHVAFEYRKNIEKMLGVPMPAEGDKLPEDVEVELSRLTAQAAQKITQQNQQEAQQAEAAKQQADPLTQIQQKELQLKEQELQHRIQMDQAKMQLESKVKMENIEVQRDRIKSEDRREGARLGVRVASQIEDASRKDKLEGTRIGIDIAKSLGDKLG